MEQAHADYSRYRRRLIVGFVLLLAMLVLTLSWKIRASYVNDRDVAEGQTKNFVQAMDVHVSNAIQIVDLKLLHAADTLRLLNPDQLERPDTIRQMLVDSARAPDTNFWLIFLDADGNGSVASNGLAIAGVSYADRPYFAVHAKGVDAGLFVSEPQVGKVSRRRLFFLSRAVRSPSGRFLGVVAAAVDASVLADVFRNALLAPELSVTLLHVDGKLIARAPRFEESFATDLSSSPLFRHLKNAPTGTYEATSVVDGTTRVYAYRSLAGLPLVVTVGIAKSAWTTGLIDDFLVAGVSLAIIVAILLISARSALDSYRRLDRSEADHRLLNADLQSARGRLTDSERRMRMVTNHVPALVSYLDAEERYVFRNAAYAKVESIDANAMIGRTLREVHGELNYDVIATEVARALHGESVAFEREISVDGVRHHWKFAFTPDTVDGDEVIGFYSVMTDITDRKRVEEDLRSQARVDTLTGLANRQQLYERLEEAIARSRRSSTQLACLYLDIDHFKQVNDTLGHASGDALLRQFGARLHTIVRETDLVARLAGDEFVVVLEGLDDESGAESVAVKIIDGMKVPFVIEGVERSVTASIGVVVSSGRDDDPDSLLKKADSRLYTAKRRGRNLFEIHDAFTDEG